MWGEDMMRQVCWGRTCARDRNRKGEGGEGEGKGQKGRREKPINSSRIHLVICDGDDIVIRTGKSGLVNLETFCAKH